MLKKNLVMNPNQEHNRHLPKTLTQPENDIVENPGAVIIEEKKHLAIRRIFSENALTHESDQASMHWVNRTKTSGFFALRNQMSPVLRDSHESSSATTPSLSLSQDNEDH